MATPFLESLLLAMTGVCFCLGGLGILLGRTSRCPIRAAVGRKIFVGTLLLLGAALLLAAFYKAEGLVPLGLLAGALVVTMLWETPASSMRSSSHAMVPEES